MPPRESAAARKEREAREREESQKQKEAFQATVPLQLLKLLAKAQARNDVDTSVYDDPVGGVRVKFSFKPMEKDSDAFGDDERVEFTVYHMANDPYDIQAVEGHFNRLEEYALEAARKLKRAQDAYDRMSPEDREALGLLRRPT